MWNLNNSEPILTNHFKSNKHASLSGAFKKIRRMAEFEIYGDAPILMAVLNAARECGIKIDARRLSRAFNCTEESGNWEFKKSLYDMLGIDKKFVQVRC